MREVVRYPPPHHHQARLRFLALLGALFVFSLGVVAANLKLQQPLHASQLAPLIRISPTPTTGTTRLQFFSNKDLAPLTATSIQLRIENFCTLDTPCAAASPELYTTDTSGTVFVPTTTVQQQPIVAVDGYVKDTYFTFLDKENPFQLTLYQAPGDLKRAYDIRQEVIPLYLDPL